MRTIHIRTATAWISAAILIAAATMPVKVRAAAPVVDPKATEILQRMTDYLGGLERFSVHTQNTTEEVIGFGHRVDFDVSADVTIARPNKILAERKGESIDQVFYYDGKKLTLYNPSDKVYATESVPGTFEGLFEFMYETLGFGLPVSDLIYADAFPLLMQDVTYAQVIGKAFIGGVKCDHLLFSRPGVDFQVWVADSDKPLPYKYVVTDTANAGRLSIASVMSGWNLAPAPNKSRFTFVPPKGVQRISFMPLETSSGSDRW